MANVGARRYAFFQETVQGQGPTDWASEGTPFFFIKDSIDPAAAATQTMVEDERQRDRIQKQFLMIHGIKGGTSYAAQCYIHGSEDVSRAASDQAPVTPFMELLEHGFGGMRRPTSQACAAGWNTTSGDLDAVTGLAPGDWLGFVDADGRIHPRRIQSIATNTITLNMALPFSPADGDVARGLPYFYIDEQRLSDSSAGPYTLSLLTEIGLRSFRKQWETNGNVFAPTTITCERNAVPKIDWAVMAASFHTPEDGTSPDWSGVSTAGQAGKVVGVDTRCLIADRGATAVDSVQLSSFVANTGIERVPIETQTQYSDGMPGRAGYSLADTQATMVMTLTNDPDDYLDDFNAATLKQVLYERLSTDGIGWAIYAPRAQISPTPTFAPSDANRGQSLTFELLADEDTPAGATAAAWESRIQIVLC